MGKLALIFCASNEVVGGFELLIIIFENKDLYVLDVRTQKFIFFLFFGNE